MEKNPDSEGELQDPAQKTGRGKGGRRGQQGATSARCSLPRDLREPSAPKGASSTPNAHRTEARAGAAAGLARDHEFPVLHAQEAVKIMI